MKIEFLFLISDAAGTSFVTPNTKSAPSKIKRKIKTPDQMQPLKKGSPIGPL